MSKDGCKMPKMQMTAFFGTYTPVSGVLPMDDDNYTCFL